MLAEIINEAHSRDLSKWTGNAAVLIGPSCGLAPGWWPVVSQALSTEGQQGCEAGVEERHPNQQPPYRHTTPPPTTNTPPCLHPDLPPTPIPHLKDMKFTPGSEAESGTGTCLLSLSQIVTCSETNFFCQKKKKNERRLPLLSYCS